MQNMILRVYGRLANDNIKSVRISAILNIISENM